MNKEVEQKIIEMQFNNADFEQKVAQSLITLQKLRESTKLEDAGKGLDNLSKSAANVDLAPISKGVEQLNSHFDALGIFAINVFSRISNAAIDMGQQIANAITAAPKDGWKEYELNIDSVKTILNSAKDDQGLPVTLDAVNKKLDELNAYSDKTIYSFSDMTNNIGKFTNAGVSLDKSVSAIQGVANVAALAGANSQQASHAMYNFAQALGSGSVKLQDWKSIENANMATVDFKKNLVETALKVGTLVEQDGKYITTTTNMQGKTGEMTKDLQGFNDTLSAQWMTADVLVETLSKYTDETTDLGKAAFKAATEVTTFSKLIDTVKEAMGSGWMQTWQTIFGDYEESKAMWTSINDVLSTVISKSADARNGMLEAWKAAGGRDDLMEGLSNVWKAIMSVARPINDAWHMIFPGISSTGLVELTRGFKELTAKLILPRESVNNLRIVFKGLFTLISIGAQTIKSVASTVLPPFFKILAGAVGIVAKLAAGFLKWVATLTSAVQEGETVNNIVRKLLIPMRLLYKGITAFGKAIAKAFKLTKDGLSKSSDQFKSFLKILKDIGKSAGPVVILIFTRIADALAKAGKQAQTVINKFKSSDFGKGLISRLEDIKAAFIDFPKVIRAFGRSLARGKNPFKDMQFLKFFETTNVGNLAARLKTDSVKLSKAFKAFIQSVKDGSLISALAERLGKGFDTLIDKLKQIKVIGPLISAIEGFFKKLGALTGTAGLTIGSFIHNVVDKLKGIDFMSIGIFGLISSIGIFVLRWSKVGSNASKALKALSTFILNGGKMATTAVDKYNGFLKIAAAIAIIAGSIYLLSKVPAERFREVCLSLLAGFLAMFAAITILSVMKIPEDKMKSIGIAFAGLGVGFLAIAAAAKIIASMSWPEIGKAAVALVSFVGMVVIAARLAKDVGLGAGAAFVGLGAALLLLVPSVLMFSRMDAHTLIKGGIAVFTFMLMIAKAAKVAGEAKGSLGSFIGISAALLLLIPSIKILSAMDTKALLKGGAAVSALMLVMAEAAKRANGGARGFFGMALAIGVITASMFVLSKLAWSSLIASSHALAVVLKTVADALSTLSDLKFSSILKSVFALAAVLAVVGGALYLLVKYSDGGEALQGALGIAAILWAFSKLGPAIETLSNIPFQAGVVAAGNAIVFFGAMALCLGALGAISSLGDGAVGDAIAKGASVVGRVIHNFLESLITGKDADSSKIVTLGEHLNTFANTIGSFLNKLMSVTPETVDCAKNLAIAILAICAADVLDALTGWIRGKADLGGFADSLNPLIDAIVRMNDTLAGKTIDAGKINQVAKIITAFTDIAKAIPKSGGLLQKALGVQDLSTFAQDMKEFMDGGFRGFVSSVNLMGGAIGPALIAKMFIIKETTLAMTDLAKALPKSGFLSTIIDGTADLGAFAKNMASFMTSGYRDFVTQATAVPTVDLGKLKGNIIPATQEMINLSNKLKENSSIIDFIFSKGDLSKFGSTLASFGRGLGELSKSLEGVSFENISGMTLAVNKLADLNASEKIKDNYLTAFGQGLTSLGLSVGSFAFNTQTVTPEFFATMIAGITDLHNLMLVLSATDYSGVSNFTTAMQTLATVSITSFTEEFTAHVEAAKAAIQQFVSAVAEGAKDTTAFTEAAASAANAYSMEFYNHWDLANIAGLRLAAQSSKGTGCAEALAKFKEAALNCCDSYVLGFYHRWSLAKVAGQRLAKHAADGAGSSEILAKFKTAAEKAIANFVKPFNSKEPAYSAGSNMAGHAYSGAKSKNGDFYDLGQDAADGYKDGIASKADDIAREAASTVRQAINAAKTEQDSHSPSKVFRGLGHDAMDGYALGFVDRVKYVVDSVKDTGYAGIQAMQDTIGRIHDLADNNFDYQPTITPVIDLSQMSNGISTANSLLSAVQMNGLAAAAAASIANEQNEALARSKAATQLNYSKDLNSLIENTSKIINAVRQNRYAIIDGDEAFNYFDRRLGASY